MREKIMREKNEGKNGIKKQVLCSLVVRRLLGGP